MAGVLAAMKLTAVTCTHGRPEALALCHRYMRRQTRQPDQWIILDGPQPMREKVLTLIAEGSPEAIAGEAVCFFEDDDLYRPDWLAWCEATLERGYEIAGEGNAVYYHVGHRWWSECRNVRHAALCATAIHRDLLELLANVIRCYDSPFFDTRLWQLDSVKYLALPKSPSERRVIGIKGMPGRQGYSGEHRFFMPEGTNADPALAKLWEWAGEDAAGYLPFRRAAA